MLDFNHRPKIHGQIGVLIDTAQRSTPLLGSLGVLLHALPERLFATHGKDGRSHDRSQ